MDELRINDLEKGLVDCAAALAASSLIRRECVMLLGFGQEAIGRVPF